MGCTKEGIMPCGEQFLEIHSNVPIVLGLLEKIS